MNVMEVLQYLGIPLPLGVVVIVILFIFLYLAFNKFLDNIYVKDLPKKEAAPVINAAAAPETGNNAAIVAISAAVNEYRKNN